ncbi:MAG: hypothetical protein ACOH2R_02480 [Pseudomonas sp.]
MATFAKNHPSRVIPKAEDKVKWLMALNRALNCEIGAQAKTPALMKAAGVKIVNA